MRVEITQFDSSYACSELANALWNVAPKIIALVKDKYEKIKDDRTLVVVLFCTCCNQDRLMETRNAIFVSPFRGIDSGRYNISVMSIYPPFRNSGREGEAKDLSEFLSKFEDLCDKAIS